MDTLVRLGEQDRLHQAVVDKLHSRLREAADAAKQRVSEQMGSRMQAQKEKEKEKEAAAPQQAPVAPVAPVAPPPPPPPPPPAAAVPPPPPPPPAAEDKDAPPAPWDPSTELTAILHRAPIIIFSKSYCPYSARAKRILLTQLTITPAPYVVELDHHAHGRELQAFLLEKTGRGTVPNVLVNGRSLGGGDEVAGLFEGGELGGVLRRMGGKRVVVVGEEGGF